MSKRRKPMSIVVFGRRWFQKSCGNTYHTAEIYVNGDFVCKSNPQYGYESAYMTTALEELTERNRIQPNRGEYGQFSESLRGYCNREGIQLVYSVADVGLEREL